MADRSVSLHLRAVVDNFKRQMRDAQASVKGVGDESEKQSKRSSTAFGQLADRARKNKDAYDDVGGALVGLGAAAAIGVGAAVARFADFDQAMSAVQAATHESADAMADLREAAVAAGEDTQYSATEAAGAIEELAKAGVSTSDILGGGLAGALDLAAAGQLDVAQAAEIAATAMTQFGLAGADLPHVADLLAAGAGKAQGSVEDMGMALKQAGLVADQTGLTIEETTGGLAAFAKAGLVGSDAGTSFKSMLQRLTPTSKEAAGLMDELGITAYDAQGQFVGLAEFSGNLQAALADLTPEQRNAAMATIFGSDAVRAANVLYEQGEQGIREWTAAVDDSGFAAETARIKTDNLRGDVERLGGSLDTALIQTGTASNNVLRDMVQRMDALIGVYNNASPAAQGATLAIGGVTAAVGLVGGGALLAVPRMVEFYDSLGKMGKGGVAAQKGLRGVGSFLMGPWGAALAAGTLALGIWADQQLKAQMYVDDLSGSLDKQTGAISDSTREIVKNDLAARDGWWVFQKQSAFDAAGQLGLDLDLVTDAAMGNREAMEQLNAELEVWEERTRVGSEWASENKDSYVEMGAAADRVREAVEGNNGALSEAARVTEQKAEADAEAADSQAELTETVSAGEQAVMDATTAIDDLINSMNTLNGVGRSAIDMEIAWQAAIDAAEASLKENGQTLDLNTEAGRANMQALQGMASDAEELAAAILRETGSEEQMRASLASSRSSLYDTAIRFGMTEDEARKYVDRVLSVPAEAQTSIQLSGAQAAIASIDALNARINALDGSSATVTTRYMTTGSAPRGVNYAVADGGMFVNGGPGIVQAFADGGYHGTLGASQPQIRPAGGAGVLWAEDGAGPWEAFVSGHPAKRARSIGIWEETGERLGVLDAVRFDSGGFYGGGGTTVVAGGQSLEGLVIEGQMVVNGMEAQMRGVVKSELRATGRAHAAGAGRR